MVEEPIPDTPPRTNKAKRERHFVNSWTKDYKSITKSSLVPRLFHLRRSGYDAKPRAEKDMSHTLGRSK